MSSRPLPAPGAPRVSRGLGLVLFGVGMTSMSAYCTKASDAGGGSGSGGSRGASGGSSGSQSGGVSGASSGGATGSGGSSSGGATGTGGVTSTGGVVSASGGITSTGGITATGGTVGSGGMTTSGSGGDMSTSGNDAAVTDAACQMATVMFTPKIPTVFVLVDRSGSEFTDATTGTYFMLQAAVLQVVNQLQTQVRFGFGDFVGDHSSTCKTVFNSVPIALNNYTAIQKQYMTDGPLLPFGTKAETPAADVLSMVKTLLMADSGDGGKYVLFVTDSQTDFCDDGGPVCPSDAVTYRIQDMYTSGIGTLVIGLPTAQSNIAAAVLQNFANAGAGQTVELPAGVGLNTSADVASQCNSVAAWKAIGTAAGTATGASLATYGTPAGTATLFTPTSASQAALSQQIAAAVNGVKSCTFDLGNIGGQSIKVDLNQLASAHVCLSKSCPDSSELPQDATNGWSMSSATQLILNGTACDNWRMPNNNDISFDFPCKSIIFE